MTKPPRIRVRPTLVVVGLSVASCATLGGCGSAEVTRDYDRITGFSTVEAGPFEIGALGWISLYALARLEAVEATSLGGLDGDGAAIASWKPPTYVDILVHYATFDELNVVADGKRYTLRKPHYQEYTVRAAAETFVDIASANTVAGRLDRDGTEFVLTREDLSVLRRFLGECGLAPGPVDAGSR